VASLYGATGSRAKGASNFVKMVLGKARLRESLSIVNDQTMSPTATIAVADKTFDLVSAETPFGVYHMAGRGSCTWYELAIEIMRIAELDISVRPVATEADDPGSVFRRPRYTALDNAALRAVGLGDLPDWRESLREYVFQEMEQFEAEIEHA
jgi:dTDP-4-dehydrorhamnose reductase